MDKYIESNAFAITLLVLMTGILVTSAIAVYMVML